VPEYPTNIGGKEIGMGTSRKTSIAVSVLMPILIGILIIGMNPSDANGEVIGSQLIQSCIQDETGPDCANKQKVTVAVSYGLSSKFDAIRLDENGQEIDSISFTTTKTAPIVTYPLKHFHTVPYYPHEKVIRVPNILPGTQACIDSLLAPNPSCGWTYQGTFPIPYSNGICNNKSLVELIRGDPNEWWRGEAEIGVQSTIQDSYSTAHCLRQGDLSFHGYEIGEPIIDYEVTVEAVGDNEVSTFILSPRNPVHVGNIKAMLLGDMAASQHVPQLGNYILYIPSYPDTHPYVLDYQHNMLLVPREEASKDGIDLNKVSISFQTFRQHAAAATSSEAGDGLHNQLFHKHDLDLESLQTNPPAADTEYLVHGKRMFKGSMSFELGNLDENGNFNGLMEKSLKYKITEISHSMVSFTLEAQDVREIELESQGVIRFANVSTYVSMSNMGNMVVEVQNLENLAADYVVSVTNCNTNIVQPIPAQAISLNAREIKTLQFDMYTNFNRDTTNKCKATLTSPSGRVYDSVYVIFDTTKHFSKYSWELQQTNEATEVGN